MAFLKYKCAECGAEIFAKSADEVQRHGNLTFCSYNHLADYVNRIEREEFIKAHNKRVKEVNAWWDERYNEAEKKTAEFHAREARTAKEKYEDSHKNTVSIDGVLYSPDKTRLVECPKDISTFEVPEGVTEICYKAFADCTSLTSVKLPDTVKIIEQEAFLNCTNLSSVTIPSRVTKIGDSAFEGCESLKNLVIPEGVTELGVKCFYECKSLETVSIPKSIKKIGVGEQHTESFGDLNVVGCFENCYSLSTVTLPEGMKEIPAVMFRCCRNLKTISIPETVTKIGMAAFSYCGFESITIPANVTYIDDYAFDSCTKLQYVNYLGNIPGTGNWVFQDCAFAIANEKRKEKKKKIINLFLCPLKNILFIKFDKPVCIVSAALWFLAIRFLFPDFSKVTILIFAVIANYLSKTIPDLIIKKGDLESYEHEKLWNIIYVLLRFILPLVLFILGIFVF